MIGLDTNILVRLVVRDDVAQMRQAEVFLDKNCSTEAPGFVNRIALCELVWVLTNRYRIGRDAIAQHIVDLMASTDIVVEDAAAVRTTLARYISSGIEFADILIAETNRIAGCAATATFDRRAAKLDGFTAVS